MTPWSGAAISTLEMESIGPRGSLCRPWRWPPWPQRGPGPGACLSRDRRPRFACRPVAPELA